MCDFGVLHSHLKTCNTTITEMISASVLDQRPITQWALHKSLCGGQAWISLSSLCDYLKSRSTTITEMMPACVLDQRPIMQCVLHPFFYRGQARESFISLCLLNGSHAICHIACIERECNFTAQQGKQAISNGHTNTVPQIHSWPLETPQNVHACACMYVYI